MIWLLIPLNILAVSFFVLHGVYIFKLRKYLKSKHIAKWEEITPKKFMIFSREEVEIGNYFKEMQFIFSSNFIMLTLHFYNS